MHRVSLKTASRHGQPHTEVVGKEKLPTARIHIGEVFATRSATVVQTLLGSCVAVCLRDPVSCVAGMNHILLPETVEKERSARFGVHAMELLINEMMKLGGVRSRFVAKSFGAGNVVPCLSSPTVGERNAEFIRQFLATERIPLLAERLGGSDAIQVSFHTDTGRVLVRSVSGAPLSSVVEKEEILLRTGPPGRSDDSDITLF